MRGDLTPLDRRQLSCEASQQYKDDQAVGYTLTDLRVSTMSSLEGEGAVGEDTSQSWIGRNVAAKLERKNAH